MTVLRRPIVTALLVVVVSTLALPLSATPAHEATVPWSTAWLFRWLEPWIPLSASSETHPGLDPDGQEVNADPAPPNPSDSSPDLSAPAVNPPDDGETHPGLDPFG